MTTPDIEHVVKIEPTDRWVRAVFNGVTVADSTRVKLVLESRHLPVYYFPVQDVRMDLLWPSGHATQDEHKGTTTYHSMRVGKRSVERAAWTLEPPTPAATELTGMIAFYWNKIDNWYEEDDEVYAEPRDPHHRVDVLRSSRHVRVVVLGETVAESSRPSLLFETDYPTRFYLPSRDVRLDLLVPSERSTACPYKGTATYWSVRAGDTIAADMAWAYRFPIPECPKIENMICFFDEQVDAVFMDGVEMPKPQTPWTKTPTLITVTE
jgi:uncharacterized protein (DUF427 family)